MNDIYRKIEKFQAFATNSMVVMDQSYVWRRVVFSNVTRIYSETSKVKVQLKVKYGLHWD